ncbi:DNA repair protein XRCC4 isoform X1 [Manacus candei]|uniref:DNA repair protein XRCC4 isoform X1 n=2 Tax=Manacus candei TaxID=415023 RepID=UPI0022268175|nr:DNA repair protein XRCC4 isoform X1 [Manacus candei]XP_051662732.1 DNA repair protein XRCC4 isoform X1 [Manacus candei]XP_051662733.1 DNA repair protein XRCC4 isoform X1 [Manacus candei]XP_051662734.1 DNA repair protein XRCC4 isoform X1 [Manacus candei]XP_051662735.1 DNA repair protein XRCC4 isoform X1 [Manacus candei]XP_051662737.1 DNA repair protein XRCC4 isoform X1 [Manacus candei]
MEKILNRIHLVSDPEATYFLQVSWEKDLGTGFGILLSDGQFSWAGTVSEAEISREAADMEMNKEKYVEELKKALVTREESAGKYNYLISRDQENVVCQFSYERSLKDGSFRLGSVKLQEVPSPAKVVKELVGYCLDSLGKLQAKNEHLQRENERLFSNWSDAEKRLEKCVEAKEKLEADLYNRFILVLNEKKAKIRNLQKLLNEAKESAADAKCTRDDITTTQMVIKRENDYDASTDEESESLTQASLPSAPERRDSSLLGSPGVADTAPRRKRRQRTAKPAGTGPKVAAYEAEQPPEEKPDLASQKTSGQHSVDWNLETLKNTCEPEDLFDDM